MQIRLPSSTVLNRFTGSKNRIWVPLIMTNQKGGTQHTAPRRYRAHTHQNYLVVRLQGRHVWINNWIISFVRQMLSILRILNMLRPKNSVCEMKRPAVMLCISPGWRACGQKWAVLHVYTHLTVMSQSTDTHWSALVHYCSKLRSRSKNNIFRRC